MDILTGYNTRKTPQTQKAKSNQIENAAGGYVFQLDDVARLRRFLTLGSASGTYYVGGPELTRENADVVVRMAENSEDGHRVLVDTIVEVSTGGKAPKNDYALFALAIAASSGSDTNKRHALSYLPDVARTGTHLLTFAKYIEQFRGWGRGLRRAISDWYIDKTPDNAAFQAVKYRQRGGWSHRDLLRLSHPVAHADSMRSVFHWITSGQVEGNVPWIIEGFTKAQESGADIPGLISVYGLTWEMLPTEALNDPAVWEALLDNGMPQTALMRQLPRLSRLGMLPDMGGRTDEIAAQLTNTDRLVRSRVHPINVLVAQRTYQQGHSFRGTATWSPSRKIVDALDEAFYNAFGAVEPAGKRTMLALDISGSMLQTIDNMPLTAHEASAALALVQMKTEPDTHVVGFSSEDGRMFGPTAMVPLNISPRQRLDDVLRNISGLAFGRTDCSLPMKYAMRHQLDVDTFIVYTDNETYAGHSHPYQALEEYRQKSGIDAKMIVVGMTATDASIANPDDPLSMDVAGFDSGVPKLINDFSRGL